MHHLSQRQTYAGYRETGYELDLVIPALNEERRIGTTIDAVIQKALESELSLRILVVDNGCVDATAEVASRQLSSDVPVEVISCRTRGKGAAVRAGISRATAPYVGYYDADQSTPPSAIKAGVDLLRSGWEVVIGSRRCTGAEYSVPQGGLRQLGSFAFRKMASELCGPVTDTQCGFKLFHSQVAKELFASTTLTGFAFDVEVVAQARRYKHQMIELPIRWSDSPDSSFRPLVDGLRSFRELREIRSSLGRSRLESLEP
ncbi:MAG: glycosyltransferase [Acidimicrobiales bacterium]|jgi:dolichyl-phosphate beta-glucosyltransferase